MKELIEKISSYQIFNNLVPGVIFVKFINATTSISVVTGSLVSDALVWYFAGMILSRLGSLIIEPLLLKLRLIRKGDYADFLRAEKADDKIKPILESCNSYRTFAAIPVVVLFVHVYLWIEAQWLPLVGFRSSFLMLAMLALFLFSYIKQYGYVTKRVDAHKSGGNNK